jgi:hypothetical protein
MQTPNHPVDTENAVHVAPIELRRLTPLRFTSMISVLVSMNGYGLSVRKRRQRYFWADLRSLLV